MLAGRDGFDLPPGMVEREFETIWSQVEEAKEKGDLDADDEALAEDDLRARYRAIAERRVRLALILSEIGRANNIRVSEDELNRAMMEQARMMPDRAAQVFEYYRDNPEAMQSLQAPLFEDKVVDFVIEMAQVTERAVELDELTAEPADEDAAPEEGQDG